MLNVIFCHCSISSNVVILHGCWTARKIEAICIFIVMRNSVSSPHGNFYRISERKMQEVLFSSLKPLSSWYPEADICSHSVRWKVIGSTERKEFPAAKRKKIYLTKKLLRLWYEKYTSVMSWNLWSQRVSEKTISVL